MGDFSTHHPRAFHRVFNRSATPIGERDSDKGAVRKAQSALRGTTQFPAVVGTAHNLIYLEYDVPH
jgi:hypothetical protein